ncbi:uncharacterized protein L201_005446 [Kwoniella dendrophila CBS 6074]|uniref:Uncharacterized protein n=1 Tax=Kwoniella dendrophila CBS 6074 TaxID=1295534 RepID=A0AAX4K0Z1_9TREE
MPRRQITLKDLVNSPDQSPVPYDKSSTPLSKSIPASSSSSLSTSRPKASKANKANKGINQRYTLKEKEEYRKELEHRSNDHCPSPDHLSHSSPDPLNCISPTPEKRTLLSESQFQTYPSPQSFISPLLRYHPASSRTDSISPPVPLAHTSGLSLSPVESYRPLKNIPSTKSTVASCKPLSSSPVDSYKPSSTAQGPKTKSALSSFTTDSILGLAPLDSTVIIKDQSDGIETTQPGSSIHIRSLVHQDQISYRPSHIKTSSSSSSLTSLPSSVISLLPLNSPETLKSTLLTSAQQPDHPIEVPRIKLFSSSSDSTKKKEPPDKDIQAQHNHQGITETRFQITSERVLRSSSRRCSSTAIPITQSAVSSSSLPAKPVLSIIPPETPSLSPKRTTHPLPPKPSSLLVSVPHKSSLEAFGPATSLDKTPPWRSSSSQQSKPPTVRRQSARIALSSSSSSSDPPGPHQDIAAQTATISILTNAIAQLPSNPLPSSITQDNIATDMSSLPKRQSRKPSRFQSPAESDDYENPAPSAPTPKHSASTPTSDGPAFSDGTLTPPPLSQEADHDTIVVSAEPSAEDARSTGKGKSKTHAMVDTEDQAKPTKKRGRPSLKHLNSATSDQNTPSSSTPHTEGSISPAKRVTKITLNISKKSSAETTPAPATATEKRKLNLKADRSNSPTVKRAGNKGGNKKRKSESHEPDLVGQVDDGSKKEIQDPVKRVKISVKRPDDPTQLSEIPTKKGKKITQGISEKHNSAATDESQKNDNQSEVIQPKLKLKSKKSVRDYSSSESDEDEEKVRKPKKKAQRVIEDEDEIEMVQPKKKIQKVVKPEEADEDEGGQSKKIVHKALQGEEVAEKKDSPLAKTKSLAKMTSSADVAGSVKTATQSSTSPVLDSRDQSPLPKAQTIKKKLRPSEPSDLTQKKLAQNKGPDTPVNKSEGLSRTKSTLNAEEGSIKKPLPLKKPINSNNKAGQAGTPVATAKPSAHGIGLLGNTLALLQGTSSTPKAKDPSKKDNAGKDVKKDTPKITRRGGWQDEWVLTAEQEREYAASKAQRETERKRREEWRINPVNLQEAKDSYRIDAIQPRTIPVAGAMGIGSSIKPSALVSSLLGY